MLNGKIPDVVTISGLSGTGKGATARALERRIGYTRRSIGDLIRADAEKLGVDLEGWRRIAEGNSVMDRRIDVATLNMLQNEKHFILESRIGHWLARKQVNAVKVLLTAPDHVRWSRIAVRDYKHLPFQKAYHRALRETSERDADDLKRYKALYDIDDLFCPDLFHIVIRTECADLDAVVSEIVHRIGFIG